VARSRRDIEPQSRRRSGQCRECGVYVGAQMASDKGRFGVLNVLTLRPLLALPAAEPMEYGAESPQGRRLRRESRWTPLTETSL
jgi:hypothetical protein